MSMGKTKNFIDTLLRNVFSNPFRTEQITAKEVINDIYAESELSPDVLISFAQNLPNHSLLQEDKEVLKENIKAELDEESFKVALYKNEIVEDKEVRKFLIKVAERQEAFIDFGKDFIHNQLSSKSLNEEEFKIYEAMRQAIKALREKNSERLSKLKEGENLEDDIDYSIIVFRMINVFTSGGADKKQAAKLLSKELRYL